MQTKHKLHSTHCVVRMVKKGFAGQFNVYSRTFYIATTTSETAKNIFKDIGPLARGRLQLAECNKFAIQIRDEYKRNMNKLPVSFETEMREVESAKAVVAWASNRIHDAAVLVDFAKSETTFAESTSPAKSTIPVVPTASSILPPAVVDVPKKSPIIPAMPPVPPAVAAPPVPPAVAAPPVPPAVAAPPIPAVPLVLPAVAVATPPIPAVPLVPPAVATPPLLQSAVPISMAGPQECVSHCLDLLKSAGLSVEDENAMLKIMMKALLKSQATTN